MWNIIIAACNESYVKMSLKLSYMYKYNIQAPSQKVSYPTLKSVVEIFTNVNDQTSKSSAESDSFQNTTSFPNKFNPIQNKPASPYTLRTTTIRKLNNCR